MKESSKTMYRELCGWRNRGVHLLLEGRESDPGKIVHAHQVAERGAYMRDYITDEDSEEITAICFNRVLKKEAEQTRVSSGSRVNGNAGRYDRFRERHISVRTAEEADGSFGGRKEEFRRRRPHSGRESGKNPDTE